MNIRKIISTFIGYDNPKYIYKGIAFVNSINDISKIPKDRIFIVQRGGRNRWAIFQCPCGHNERIEVNLMKSINPFWKIKITNNKVSLWPSIIAKNKKCHAHFWIINNKAYWINKKNYY